MIVEGMTEVIVVNKTYNKTNNEVTQIVLKCTIEDKHCERCTYSAFCQLQKGETE